MLDIKLIRENPELVKKDLKKRKDEEKLELLDNLIKKDKEHLELLKKSQDLRHQRNEVTNEIRKQKKLGQDASKILKQAKKIPEQIKEIEEKQNKLAKEIRSSLMRLPNITHESVPYGKDDTENIEIKKVGKPKKIDFELISHGELAEKLGIAEFKKAAQVSGAGFYYLIEDLAMLNQAISQFAVFF